MKANRTGTSASPNKQGKVVRSTPQRQQRRPAARRSREDVLLGDDTIASQRSPKRVGQERGVSSPPERILRKVESDLHEQETEDLETSDLSRTVGTSSRGRVGGSQLPNFFGMPMPKMELSLPPPLWVTGGLFYTEDGLDGSFSGPNPPAKGSRVIRGKLRSPKESKAEDEEAERRREAAQQPTPRTLLKLKQDKLNFLLEERESKLTSVDQKKAQARFTRKGLGTFTPRGRNEVLRTGINVSRRGAAAGGGSAPVVRRVPVPKNPFAIDTAEITRVDLVQKKQEVENRLKQFQTEKAEIAKKEKLQLNLQQVSVPESISATISSAVRDNMGLPRAQSFDQHYGSNSYGGGGATTITVEQPRRYGSTIAPGLLGTAGQQMAEPTKIELDQKIGTPRLSPIRASPLKLAGLQAPEIRLASTKIQGNGGREDGVLAQQPEGVLATQQASQYGQNVARGEAVLALMTQARRQRNALAAGVNPTANAAAQPGNASGVVEETIGSQHVASQSEAEGAMGEDKGSDPFDYEVRRVRVRNGKFKIEGAVFSPPVREAAASTTPATKSIELPVRSALSVSGGASFSCTTSPNRGYFAVSSPSPQPRYVQATVVNSPRGSQRNAPYESSTVVIEGGVGMATGSRVFVDPQAATSTVATGTQPNSGSTGNLIPPPMLMHDPPQLPKFMQDLSDVGSPRRLTERAEMLKLQGLAALHHTPREIGSSKNAAGGGRSNSPRASSHNSGSATNTPRQSLPAEIRLPPPAKRWEPNPNSPRMMLAQSLVATQSPSALNAHPQQDDIRQALRNVQEQVEKMAAQMNQLQQAGSGTMSSEEMQALAQSVHMLQVRAAGGPQSNSSSEYTTAASVYNEDKNLRRPKFNFQEHGTYTPVASAAPPGVVMRVRRGPPEGRAESSAVEVVRDGSAETVTGEAEKTIVERAEINAEEGSRSVGATTSGYVSAHGSSAVTLPTGADEEGLQATRGDGKTMYFSARENTAYLDADGSAVMLPMDDTPVVGRSTGVNEYKDPELMKMAHATHELDAEGLKDQLVGSKDGIDEGLSAGSGASSLATGVKAASAKPSPAKKAASSPAKKAAAPTGAKTATPATAKKAAAPAGATAKSADAAKSAPSTAKSTTPAAKTKATAAASAKKESRAPSPDKGAESSSSATGGVASKPPLKSAKSPAKAAKAASTTNLSSGGSSSEDKGLKVKTAPKKVAATGKAEALKSLFYTEKNTDPLIYSNVLEEEEDFQVDYDTADDEANVADKDHGELQLASSSQFVSFMRRDLDVAKKAASLIAGGGVLTGSSDVTKTTNKKRGSTTTSWTISDFKKAGVDSLRAHAAVLLAEKKTLFQNQRVAEAMSVSGSRKEQGEGELVAAGGGAGEKTKPTAAHLPAAAPAVKQRTLQDLVAVSPNYQGSPGDGMFVEVMCGSSGNKNVPRLDLDTVRSSQSGLLQTACSEYITNGTTATQEQDEVVEVEPYTDGVSGTQNKSKDEAEADEAVCRAVGDSSSPKELDAPPADGSDNAKTAVQKSNSMRAFEALGLMTASSIPEVCIEGGTGAEPTDTEDRAAASRTASRKWQRHDAEAAGAAVPPNTVAVSTSPSSREKPAWFQKTAAANKQANSASQHHATSSEEETIMRGSVSSLAATVDLAAESILERGFGEVVLGVGADEQAAMNVNLNKNSSATQTHLNESRAVGGRRVKTASRVVAAAVPKKRTVVVRKTRGAEINAAGANN